MEAATPCAAHVQLSCSRKTAMFALLGSGVTFFGGSGRARFEHPMRPRDVFCLAGNCPAPSVRSAHPGDANETGQFVLGQAHTKTGITQSHWVDAGFRSHGRHPKASRGRADGRQPRPATGAPAERGTPLHRGLPLPDF